jgi:pimeloyl-ACP methyl ester carboxylesterase
MQISTSIRTLAIALSATTLVAACGESAPGDPTATATATATATVSGVVRAATGAVVERASVRIGSATDTTGADGRFELRNLPVGSATMVTSAPRFDQRSESVTLNAGTNARDVVLSDQTIFTHQNVLAYLPTGKSEYRAAIVFLPGLRDPATGNPLDSRRLVSGASGAGCSIWCSPPELEDVKRRSLELAGGNVALVGTTTLLDQPADYEKLLQALSQFGAQSLHPELASIPILFVGHSQGGCTAYGFTRAHAARVAGFVTMKGGCHNPGPAGAAAAVPGFFLIGRLDEPHRTANITPVFEAGRAAGAPWSLSIDAFGHGPIVDLPLMFDWIDAVLTARLPATAGAPLRAMTETAGWLGNRSTGAVSPFACYGAARSSASWLPSREAALGWQRMAGGTAVVSAC